MKNLHLPLLSIILACLPSCTNLGNNLKNVDNYQIAGGRVTSKRDLAVGVVVANKIKWEGASYKYGALDHLMEKQLSRMLSPAFKSVVPYTGAEPVDVVLRLNVSNTFTEDLVGGNVVTGMAAMAITEYASLGLRCAAVLELSTESLAQIESTTRTVHSQAKSSKFSKKTIFVNFWTMVTTGNYGVNKQMVELMNKNSTVILDSVDRSVSLLPSSVRGKVAAAPSRPSVTRPIVRETDSLPDFDRMRPRG